MRALSDRIQRAEALLAEAMALLAEERAAARAVDERNGMNYRAAAKFVGVSVRRMQELKAEGRVPYRNVGKRVVFDAAVLDEWRKNHTVPAQ